jgi:hypothetical protein
MGSLCLDGRCRCTLTEAATAAEAAQELPLLWERFNVRPSLTMGDLAQRAGPIELVIDRDYMQNWPKVVNCSLTAGDNLYLMKTLFHPGQLLYGEADKEAAEAMRKEARRRLTPGAGESAGFSTSSSRRSREQILLVSSLGKQRRISSSHSRDGEREKCKVRSPSPRLTSSTSSGAQQLKASTPSWQDEANKSLKSLGKRKDESRAKKAPAKKKSRVRKLSSSSSSDSGEGSSSDRSSIDSSSSEDEAIGEDEILNRGDEEQLHVLKGKEAACTQEREETRTGEGEAEGGKEGEGAQRCFGADPEDKEGAA